MMQKPRILIDSDPGVDDAIAILYAIKCDAFNISLISTEGGNAPIENITSNAIHLTELLNYEIPIAQGYDSPLKRPSTFATNAQGALGLGGYKYNKKNLKHKPLEGEACDLIYKSLIQYQEKTTILSIGPMTNLAKLILKYPDCKKYIKQIIFESGTKEKIIGKPYKSFNIGYDPESAEIVFKSGIPLVMIPMELGHFAYLDHDDIKQIKKLNKIGKIFAKMFSNYHDYHVGKLGAAVHDACVVHYLLYPQDFQTEKANICIKYYKTETDDYGYVDIDFNKKPNATICMDMNTSAFKHDLYSAFIKCSDNKLS